MLILYASVETHSAHSIRLPGYGKGRFYFGIFGLIAVAIAFAATAVYAVVVGDVGTAVAAAAGSLLMLGVVIWRLETWSRKIECNE